MSAYCTQADILGEIQERDLVALTDDATPRAGVIDTTVLNQVIANASGVIDRMVGNIYTVPFSTIPPSVRSMAISIACYRLYRRREVPDEKNKFAEEYRETMETLKAIQAGDAVLDQSVERSFSQVAANTDVLPWGGSNAPTSSR